MGNKNISCCGYSNDNYNLQLTNHHNGSVILKKLQARMHYFLQRLKITKFLETNKSKIIKILSKHGCEFYTYNDSNEILKLNRFAENAFSLNFPFLENSKLLANKESNEIISKNIKDYKNEIAEFNQKISNRSFQNIVELPVYKDSVTEDLYYAYFNLLDMCNIGQYVIIKKNGIKIELNIKNPKSNRAKGIVIYPNGDIYVGDLLLERIILNNAGLNNINTSNINKLKTNVLQNEANEIQISESYTHNNYANSNYTGNTNNNINKKQITNNPQSNEIALNEDLMQNSFLIEEKVTHRNSSCQAFDPFAVLELDKIEFIERIVNATPFGEGILIQSNKIIISSNWDIAFIKENSSIRIIHEKFDFEAKIKNSSIDFSNIILYDYVNNSKYEGEALPAIQNKTYPTEDNYIYNNFAFEKIIKNGKGKLYSFTGEIYEGSFKNDYYHGEGILFEPKNDEELSPGIDFMQNMRQIKTKINNEDDIKLNKKSDVGNTNANLDKYIASNKDGVITKGIWLNGKLNGKGLVCKNNVKQKCVWRFGRLVNSIISLNKKYKLNERVYDFLAVEDLEQIAYKLKTKSILGYLTKNNCKNLLKLKVFECLNYNPETNKEIKNILNATEQKVKDNTNNIKNLSNAKSETNKINENISNKLNLIYNKKFFEFLCKEENYLYLFDAIFDNCYDSFIPAIGVKCNGGYPNKLLHYSNAFDPSRSNNYTSNYIRAFGKNVDITGAFISLDQSNKKKVLEKYANFTSNGYSADKQLKSINKKNSNLISLDVERSKNININKKIEDSDINDIEYISKMAKTYSELKRKIISNKNNNKNQTAYDSENLKKELFKFLLSLNFSKIFKYKKNLNYSELEREAEVENLSPLKDVYGNLVNQFSSFYTFDYNNRSITDIQVYKKLKFDLSSKFCINRVILDFPFNVNELNKVTLPAKTIVFLLHKGIPSNEELLNFGLDPDENNNNKIKLDNLGKSLPHILSINPRILEIANDAFLSKFDNCSIDDNKLALLLNEINKVNNKYQSETDRINNENRKAFDNLTLNKGYNLDKSRKLENQKFTDNHYDNLNILNVTKKRDNLFIEFDTETYSDAKVKLLGICFVNDYNMPNIIDLKPFYHFGNLITTRLVNQQVLCPNFKPSAIDVGSITFYGEEFRFDY